MAKFEKEIEGNFEDILGEIEKQVVKANITTKLKGKSDFIVGKSKCSVRVFERSSNLGNRKVTLNVTLFQNNDSKIYVSAITSSGSLLTFIKTNSSNEKRFLNKFKKILENLNNN